MMDQYVDTCLTPYLAMISWNYIPHVAKEWEISEDNLTITFYLRDDVKFQDGEPLTAHDVGLLLT